MITVELAGGEAVQRLLRRLPAQVQRQIAMKALRAGGAVIAAEARSIVSVRKGDLRRSITVAAKSLAGDDDPLPHVFVGPRSKMGARASWEELGTIKQAPDPFLRPALDLAAGRAVATVGAVLGREIERRSA